MARPTRKIFSVKGPASSYLAAMFVGSFFCALAFYMQFQVPGLLLVLFSWVVVPVLALTDRIVFDGKRVYRSGLWAKGWAYTSGSKFWVKLNDIEQVETLAIPSLKRGGRIYFKYRTLVRGGGLEFLFSSGGRDYRRLVQALFRAVPEEVLDAGSIELRDYLADPELARTKARESEIPSAEVLEQAFRNYVQRRGKHAPYSHQTSLAEKAVGLRLLGNQLRFSGSLLQALESFRRAASLQPHDPWLLFDFARCIHAFAGAEGDVKLRRQAAAMMRLAERRAAGDGRLLARLGEGYFQLGEWRRSAAAFRKAADAVGDQFRSIRGMAEIALRDGKLAHVVHNFSTAARAAQSPGARRWSSSEAEYFSRLSNDDEYMEMELGRVHLLDTLDRWRGRSFRLSLAGFPLIGVGLYIHDPLLANSGWALSGAMLVLWVGILLATRIFATRIEPDLLDD